MSLCLIAAISIIAKQHLRNRALETLLENTNKKLESLQVSFGRFTPHEVIESLTDLEGKYTPSMRLVTVLFADLKGFTRMCEGMDPAAVVSILNGYFRCMSKAVTDHHGQVTLHGQLH